MTWQSISTPRAKKVSAPEDLAMAAGADQNQFLFGRYIEKDPIWAYVTVPMSGPIAAQPMRPATRWQLFLRLKKIDNRLQFVQIPPLLFRPAEILFESGGR
jgi:hypothetical protein